MADSAEIRRIQPTDCLFECLTDLERAGKALAPWDAPGWLTWESACGDLLAAVRCPMQRLSWAWSLAQAFTHRRPGLPMEMVTGHLLQRARLAGQAVR